MFSTDDVNELYAAAGGNYLNAKTLKALPPPYATKVRIVGGGSHMVPTYDDKTKLKKEVFVEVESTIGSFDGTKIMPLNITNLRTLLNGLGKQPDSWKGREIGVYFDPEVKVGSEVKGGLRVKVFEADPFAKLAAAAPAAVTVPADDIPF